MALLPLSKKVLDLRACSLPESSLNVFLICSWIFSWCSRFLPQPKDMQIRLNAWRCKCVCLFKCVTAVTNNLSRVYPAFCLMHYCNPAHLRPWTGYAGLENGWIVDGSSRIKNLPRIVRVRTMFFMILSHRLPHALSGVSTLGSRWLSSILTSTCFCILLALKEVKKEEELVLITGF